MAEAGEAAEVAAAGEDLAAEGEDLVAVGDHIEQEKDRLLNVVSIIFARTIFILFN